MGLLEITFLVLLIVKVTGLAAGLSWWWVFSPLLVAAGLYIIAATGMVLGMAAGASKAKPAKVTRPGNRWN